MGKADRSNFKELFSEASESTAEEISVRNESQRNNRPANRMLRKKVPLVNIKPNPRNMFNMAEDEDYLDLLEGIKKTGSTLEDIVCLPEDENGIYYIISGERRWKALNEAGVEETMIKILPERLTGSDEIIEIMKANSGRRKNYPYDIPLGLCDLYSQLAQEGITDVESQKKIAQERLTISSDRTFRNHNKLASLPRDIIAIGAKGLLTRDEGLFLADALSSEKHRNFAEAALNDIRKADASELSEEKKAAEVKATLETLKKIVNSKPAKADQNKKPAAMSLVKKINKLTSITDYEIPNRKAQRETMVQMVDESMEFLKELKEKLLEK